MSSPPFAPGPGRLAWSSSPELGKTRGAVLVPTGAVEQHGPHLATGVDIWLATAVALGVAGRDPSIRVAEPISYGSSAHHLAFPGTISLRPSTFIAIVVDVCRSLARDGFFPIVLNGHGGNRGALQVAVSELGADGVRSAAFSYFDLIREDAAAILPDADQGCGHACALETSLMLHLFPGSARAEAIPAGGTPSCWPDPHLYSPSPITVWRGFEEINPTGVIGKPADATAEAGAKLYDAAVTRSLEAVLRLRDGFAPLQPR